MTDEWPIGTQNFAGRLDWSAAWGPDATWRAAFGGGAVLDELTTGIRSFWGEEHRRYPAKAEPWPLAIGCVPWLTSRTVVDALIELGPVCIAVDKSNWGAKQHHRRQVQRLNDEAHGVWQRIIPRLDTMGPRDSRGDAPLIHPSSGMPGNREIGPVRLVGWSKEPTGRIRPLLHAKLLVLCIAWTWENDGGGWDDLLTPLWVWSGSANWTEARSMVQRS